MKYSTIHNDPINRSTIVNPWSYWDDGFSEEEISKLIEYTSNLPLLNATTIGTKENIEEARKTRKSDIGWIRRDNDTAWFFDRFNFIVQNSNQKFYNFDLNGYDSIQYTVYDENEEGNYGWHMDMCMDVNMGEPRKLSLTMLLNDDFEGGEFEINKGTEKNAEIIPTKKGRCILFPSWIIHQVKPVTRGYRKSLVIWVTGPKFQ